MGWNNVVCLQTGLRLFSRWIESVDVSRLERGNRMPVLLWMGDVVEDSKGAWYGKSACEAAGGVYAH